MALPTGYNERKEFPLMTMLSAYFPDAIEALVALCCAGNKQHDITVPKGNPFYMEGDRIAWDRTKSTEELETLMRHLWDHTRAKRAGNPDAMLDADGILHIVKVFWRAGAEAQKTIEMMQRRAAQSAQGPVGAPVAANQSVGVPVAPLPGTLIPLCPECHMPIGLQHSITCSSYRHLRGD